MKNNNIINLAGIWEFAMGEQETFTDTIALPSTTEVGEKGNPAAYTQETRFLSRKRPYTGICRYKRKLTIPKEMSGKRIYLYLERTKYTEIFVDGRSVSRSHETIIPQRHDLTAFLTSGKHELLIEADNNLSQYEDFPESLYNGHQFTEHTQTNWNGILGGIYLKACDPVVIENAAIEKCRGEQAFTIDLEIINYDKEQEVELIIHYGPENKQEIKTAERNRTLARGNNDILIRIEEDGLALWNEFDRNLYQIRIILKSNLFETSYDTVTGFRDVTVLGKRILLNNEPIFLRGNLDCCIYPLTGYAPMETEQWLTIFRQAREYGINHYRFHSWCPPEAAFAAADREGIYLQVELSCFANSFYEEDNPLCDKSLNRFLYDQSQKLLKEYGNHPSFLIFAPGNEMTGDIGAFAELLAYLKKLRPDKLYTQGSNNFLEDPVCSREDDLWVTMRTTKTDNVRASFSHGDKPLGHIQLKKPYTTIEDYGNALAVSEIPVISHEAGQYQASPNYKEAEKYKGITESVALKVFRNRLKEKRLEARWEEFFYNSGDLLVQCYKEEVESLLRTKDLGGFQLLGLQDFPGQGTALVGIWDSFLDSKGFITPEQWREFCNSQVILLKMKKGIYTEGEAIEGEIWIFNYGKEDIVHKDLTAVIYSHDRTEDDCGGKAFASGEYRRKTYCDTMEKQEKDEILGEITFPDTHAPKGNLTYIQKINIGITNITKATAAYIELNCGHLKNRYPIWIYPHIPISREPVPLLFQTFTKETEEALKQGKTVGLFSTEWEKSIEGFFPPDFWCYSMFKKACEEKGTEVAPGTLGLVCNKNHGALKHFPTESCSGWQWRQIVNLSRPVILDEEAGCDIIVQVIDNFDRNHKLGLIFEKQVYEGKLVICAADLLNHLDIPEVKQLFYSLAEYIKSHGETSVKV